MSAAPATITLTTGHARATVALRGAELRAWHVGDTSLLWEPNPTIWAEVAPILFPVVGWTRGARILVGGRSYPLGLHGFARHRTFSVIEQRQDHLRLVDTADDETRALYPFDWMLEVEHVLDGPALITRLTIRNTGDTPMPYACGLHPGFRWPFAGEVGEDYSIIFAERETAQVPAISPEGLFTRETRRVPLDGRRLALSPALMAREALCFLDARSRSLGFAHTSGAAIDVALERFPHIALWSRPGGDFLCIEPWTGHGDYVDTDGDFKSKPSMLKLAPGETRSHAATFTYSAPHRIV